MDSVNSIADAPISAAVSYAFKILKIEERKDRPGVFFVFLAELPGKYVCVELDELQDPQRFQSAVADQLETVEPSEEAFKAFEARLETLYGNRQIDLFTDEQLDYFARK